MSLQIKTYVSSQVSKYLRDNYKSISISALKILRNKIPGQFSVYVPLDNLNSETLRKEFECDKSTNNSIKDIAKCEITNHQGVKILLENNFFVESILKSIVVDPPKKGIPTPKRIIFEYSSPNIAKPFHVGHLRSTIIGNFLSNINKYLCEDVVRINYLGDWGTQFGMLKVGIDLSEMKLEQIRENPIQLLYEAYVKANKLATVDDSINTKAREVFKQLESGQFEDIKKWEMYREFTINELKRTYERLGVVFDNYAWESMYSSKDIQHIVNQLEESGIIKLDDVGRKVACVNDRKVTVTKSDGSSLYLTRDIAAALDRYDKYSFDEMYYIVDNAQTDHFVALFNILDQMKTSFAKNCKHIKFGRIKGMSTRKGTVVFLKDILDEAKNKMLDSQKTSPTTKASLDDEVTSDILGTTAVIINDLKIRRQRDYEFSWENALQNHGDSGIRLQYLHCRLWSIEQNCGVTLPDHCKPELIPEPEALMVIQELARFDDVLEHSRNEMEACVLVIYLFKLSGVVNSAIKVLQVKNQPNEVAGQRLLLFHASRLVVKQGLEILGIKPLNQM